MFMHNFRTFEGVPLRQFKKQVWKQRFGHFVMSTTRLTLSERGQWPYMEKNTRPRLQLSIPQLQSQRSGFWDISKGHSRNRFTNANRNSRNTPFWTLQVLLSSWVQWMHANTKTYYRKRQDIQATRHRVDTTLIYHHQNTHLSPPRPTSVSSL